MILQNKNSKTYLLKEENGTSRFFRLCETYSADALSKKTLTLEFFKKATNTEAKLNKGLQLTQFIDLAPQNFWTKEVLGKHFQSGTGTWEYTALQLIAAKRSLHKVPLENLGKILEEEIFYSATGEEGRHPKNKEYKINKNSLSPIEIALACNYKIELSALFKRLKASKVAKSEVLAKRAEEIRKNFWRGKIRKQKEAARFFKQVATLSKLKREERIGGIT